MTEPGSGSNPPGCSTMIQRPLTRRWCLAATLLTGGIAGCVDTLATVSPAANDAGAPIVLTFDDGPIRADVANPGDDPNAERLLDPLRQILAQLQSANIQAVFYVRGPGNDAAAKKLLDIYSEGFREIHDAGHVLGYHAYNHDPSIWSPPFEAPEVAEAKMAADLDALETFVAQALASLGLTKNDVFSPIF